MRIFYEEMKELLGDFNNILNSLKLVEIQMASSKFTLSNLRDHPSLAKLDLLFCFIGTPQRISNGISHPSDKDYFGSHTPATYSQDSTPNREKKQKPFRFEQWWEEACSFENAAINVVTKLRYLHCNLRKWGRTRVGNLFTRKSDMTPEGMKKRKNIRNEFESLLTHEETFWPRRSRTQWVVDGDRNPIFSHQR